MIVFISAVFTKTIVDDNGHVIDKVHVPFSDHREDIGIAELYEIDQEWNKMMVLVGNKLKEESANGKG